MKENVTNVNLALLKMRFILFLVVQNLVKSEKGNLNNPVVVYYALLHRVR